MSSNSTIEKLIDRAPLAVIFIGVLVFVIGAAGGLPVGSPPLQVTDFTWRIGLGGMGVILVIAGLLLLSRENEPRNRLGAKERKIQVLSCSKYGLNIVSPAEYDEVRNSFQVSGTLDRDLPDRFTIWTSTFEIYEDGKNRRKKYWPQEPARLVGHRWYSQINHIGGNTGQQKEFLVLLVGPEGQALFRYFKAVGHEGFWPPIDQLTSDVIECATGKVRIM
jgi:hypothetical protein